MEHDIKHISLDFWNTIGIANPEFAKRRNEILSKYSKTILLSGESHTHTPDYCRRSYDSVKRFIDGQTHNGKHHSTDECFAILVDWLEVDNPLHHTMTLMKGELWEAFHENPPIILPEIVEELNRLRENDYALSIGSNTNFIPGQVIREAVLDKLGVFNFYVFSDELGVSKPDEKFFSRIYYNSYQIVGRASTLMKNVVHIGDSIDFDYKPALKYGINAINICNPHELSTILKRY